MAYFGYPAKSDFEKGSNSSGLIIFPTVISFVLLCALHMRKRCGSGCRIKEVFPFLQETDRKKIWEVESTEVCRLTKINGINPARK